MPRVRYLIAVLAVLTVVTVIGGAVDNHLIVTTGLALLIATSTISVLLAAISQLRHLRRQHQATAARLSAIEKALAQAGREAAKDRGTLLADLLTNQQALSQLMSRYLPTAPLPKVGGWSMDPVDLLWLTDHIECTKPRVVVECGSGTSTVWMGMALRAAGCGQLIALEHLPAYAERTQALIVRHGLAEWVQVRLAPLRPTSTPRGEFEWYSVDPAEFDTIDLLVVDGPPGTGGRHARYPAVSVLGGRLMPGAAIVADDIGRPDEADMLEYWLADNHQLGRQPHVSRRLGVLIRS